MLGVLISCCFVIPLFGFGFIIEEIDKWHFRSLWLSVISLFWCFGLLLITQMYKKLPNYEGKVRPLLYFNVFLSWYGAIFLTIWFLGLLFMSIVAPFLILFS